MKKQLLIVGIALLVVLFSGCPVEDDTVGTGEPVAIQPGDTDALAGNLLILQAYGSSNDANGASHSFVELYNASNAEIDLSGITLYYADGTSVAATARPNTNTEDGLWKIISLNGLLPAETSFLVLGSRQNTSGRLQITDDSGDINDPNFTLNNRAFKVAIIRSTNALNAQNPFNMGNMAKAAGYIDLLGSANEYSADGSERDRIFGFETVPARNSASVAARRNSLIDSDNNSADFAAIDYRVWTATNPDRTTAEQLEVYRPKNLDYGAWDPFAEPLPPPEGTERLMILQANTHGNNNGGGGGFSNSLVELYNNTNTEINLTSGNYYLHIGSETEWTNSIKLEGSIPARSSFLIVSNNTASGNSNATPRAVLPAPDQIYDFVLINSNFKVTLMINQSTLSVDNPFTEASLSADYVDMLGAGTANGFEAQSASASRPQGPRRTSLTDTDNNQNDFAQADFRGQNAGNGVPDSELHKIWPRNSTMGAWNPITGLPEKNPFIVAE